MEKNIFEKIFGLYKTDIDVVGSVENKIQIEELLDRDLPFFEALTAIYYDVFGHFTKIHCEKNISITTHPHSGVSIFLIFVVGTITLGHLLFEFLSDEGSPAPLLIIILFPFAVLMVVRMVGLIKHSMTVRRVIMGKRSGHKGID